MTIIIIIIIIIIILIRRRDIVDGQSPRSYITGVAWSGGDDIRGRGMK
jgi:hypothetical protein